MNNRIPIAIPVRPWFADHCFNGKVIFPAVEAMLLLAKTAQEIQPDSCLQNMEHAAFSKLLEIPDGAKEIDVLVECEETEDGLSCKLLSKIQFAKISRIKEHAALYFAKVAANVTPLSPLVAKEDDLQIEAARIYSELVPFGPAYRTICDTLYLRKTTAVTSLRAAKVGKKQKMEGSIGSPFPLDGAMHAACVLGQCVADFVPFPVGFERRCIHKPTVAGTVYNCTVQLLSQTENELLFDLTIFAENGEPCETVKALRMRDVTGGMIRPAADLPGITAFP
ncbi:MAG: hypothetical protein DSY80_09900 [Desulfocapsa sp.]|nr:MAG: hypothetical protein DSY80_09900 [Desulfocapsa sp.]